MPRTIAEAESSSAIFRERNTIGTIAYSSVFNGCRRTVGTDRRKPRIFIASRTSPNSRMIVGAKRSMTTRTSIALAGIGSFRRLAVSLPEGIRKSRYAGIAGRSRRSKIRPSAHLPARFAFVSYLFCSSHNTGFLEVLPQ